MKILSSPSGGLGHRIQNIDASIAFSRHVGAEIQVLWFIGPLLNCSFYDLFEPIEGVEVIETKSWSKYKEIQQEFQASQVLDGEYFKAVKPQPNHWNKENFSEDDRLIIKSWHRFYAPVCGQTNFVPTKKILNVVRNNSTLTDKCTGIHVRRTDHKYAISASPTEEFFKFLDSRPAEEPFFLCTDSEEERKRFEDRYKGRVRGYRPRSLDRANPIAIEDALIEMLLLSRCPAIVASDGSLFSLCAAYFGKSFLHRIKPQF